MINRIVQGIFSFEAHDKSKYPMVLGLVENETNKLLGSENALLDDYNELLMALP